MNKRYLLIKILDICLGEGGIIEAEGCVCTTNIYFRIAENVP